MTMRTSVRFILTFWMCLAGALTIGLASQVLGPRGTFAVALLVLLLEWWGIFAIWRTQRTFRRLMHWVSAGLWPRTIDPP